MRLKQWRSAPPRDDWDDDGTPDWRARHAPPLILRHKETPFGAWYRKASPLDVFVFFFVSFLLLGALLFFGGLVLIFVAAQL